MKFLFSILFLSILLIGCCDHKPDNSANEAFERNSQTVLANLEAFQNENLDYSMYAKDFIMRGTGFGQKDSLSLDEVMTMDKKYWETYDFRIVSDTLNLLPGVNPESKKTDGSVRYYAKWEVTLSATDSTEAKSGEIQLYESFDFNAEGKITFQQGYADFTGLMMYLHSKE